MRNSQVLIYVPLILDYELFNSYFTAIQVIVPDALRSYNRVALKNGWFIQSY